jgi:lambda family phage holin
MKPMDNKPDFWLQVWYWLASIKAQGIGAILSAVMAYLRGRYNGGKFRHTLIDATMCAFIAWFIRDVLVFLHLSIDLSYIGSVIIGYLGTDFLGRLLRQTIDQKAGVRDEDK